MSKRSKKLVPQCSKALEAMKYEIATEIGLIQASQSDLSSEFSDELGGHSGASNRHINWGDVTSRQNGYIGGSITKRLIEQAQNSFFNLN